MQKIFKIVGWLYRFSYKTGKDRVRAHSAEAGFFIIMSVFPIVMLLLALLRYTPLTADEIVLTFEGLTPFEITPLVQPMVNSIYRQSTSLVPWTVLVALWTAGKGDARAVRRVEFHLSGGGDEKLLCDTLPLCLLYSRNDSGTCREPWYSCVRLWH